MHDINFIAIDFETASNAQAAICEAGISIVKGGKVVETRSWLVRPKAMRTTIGTRVCMALRQKIPPMRLNFLKCGTKL